MTFLKPLVESIIEANHELGDEEFVLRGLVGEALVTRGELCDECINCVIKVRIVTCDDLDDAVECEESVSYVGEMGGEYDLLF